MVASLCEHDHILHNGKTANVLCSTKYIASKFNLLCSEISLSRGSRVIKWKQLKKTNCANVLLESLTAMWRVVICPSEMIFRKNKNKKKQLKKNTIKNISQPQIWPLADFISFSAIWIKDVTHGRTSHYYSWQLMVPVTCIKPIHCVKQKIDSSQI